MCEHGKKTRRYIQSPGELHNLRHLDSSIGRCGLPARPPQERPSLQGRGYHFRRDDKRATTDRLVRLSSWGTSSTILSSLSLSLPRSPSCISCSREPASWRQSLCDPQEREAYYEGTDQRPPLPTRTTKYRLSGAPLETDGPTRVRNERGVTFFFFPSFLSSFFFSFLPFFLPSFFSSSPPGYGLPAGPPTESPSSGAP